MWYSWQHRIIPIYDSKVLCLTSRMFVSFNAIYHHSFLSYSSKSIRCSKELCIFLPFWHPFTRILRERRVYLFFFPNDFEKDDTRNRGGKNRRERGTKVIWGLNRSVWWLTRPGTSSKSPERARGGHRLRRKGRDGKKKEFRVDTFGRRGGGRSECNQNAHYLSKRGGLNTPWRISPDSILTHLANMSPFSRVIGGSTVAWLFLQFRVKIRFRRISGARQARRGKFFGFTRDALPRR